MQPDHERLVFGADRADQHGDFVPGDPRLGVLDRIRADGGTGQRRFWNIGIATHTQRIEVGESFVGSGDGVYVDLLDPRLFDDQVAEADQKFLKPSEVNSSAATNAFE